MAQSLSVSLGTSGNKLSKDDLAGALFCSMAVYQKNAGAELLLREAQAVFPSPTFKKVHMSMDPPKGQKRGQKFLVAYSGECVFIAFRGTKNFMDVASDIKTNSERRFGGCFHKGFYDRADSFLGSDHLDPLPELLDIALRSGTRIIFCGHSLGGAVAHMVLFRFLVHTRISIGHLTSETYPDSMISIAFGAPHICDEEAAKNINDNANFKWRFINFVNQNDPVPHLLHDLRKSSVGILRGVLEEADTVLKSMGGFTGRCMDGFTEAGPVGALHVAVGEAGQQATRIVVKSALKITRRIQDCSIGDTVDLSEDPRKPDFYPVGQYLCIQRNDDGWYCHRYCGSELPIQELFLQKVQYTRANVENHLLDSYRRALIEVRFIDSPSRHGNSVSAFNIHSRSSDRCLVKTPAPKVSIARWKAEEHDSNQRFIIVEGENLLFLREAVSVTGSHGQDPWKIGKQSDNFLMIYDPKDSTQKEPKDFGNAISMVIIKTAFGETSHPILPAEDYPSEEKRVIGANRMLLKVAQSLMVKATPPLGIRPDSDESLMNSLDDIMHCVPSLKGKLVSTKLTQITTFSNTSGSEFEKHIETINYMFKSVISCSTSCLRVDYESSGLMKRIRRFVRRHRMLAMPAVVMSILVLPVTLGAALGVLIFHKKKTIIDGYELILQRAIEEASEWPKSSELENNDDVCGSQNSSSCDDLETVLVKTVAGSSIFKDMVTRAHLIKSKDVPSFKSDLFLNATHQSRRKLLRRIKVVCDATTLFNKVVQGTHYIGVFGAEDTGKSTFIKKILQKFGSPVNRAKLPREGMDYHSNTVLPYRLNSSLWLVDFPGSNGRDSYAGMWKQFTALSSSAVLFLPFNFDIKGEQLQMYRDMKDNLGAQTEVTIVFNKVDLKFTSRYKEDLTVDYFENQRASSRRKFQCSDRDEVYFSCVNPDPPELLDELKKLGILGYEDLMRKVYPPLS